MRWDDVMGPGRRQQRLQGTSALLLCVATVQFSLVAFPALDAFVRNEPIEVRWAALLTAVVAGVAFVIVRLRTPPVPPEDAPIHAMGAVHDSARPQVPAALRLVHGALTVAGLVGLLAVGMGLVLGLVGPRTFVNGPSGGLTIGVRLDTPIVVPPAPLVDGSRAGFTTGFTEGSVTLAEPDTSANLAVMFGAGLGLAGVLIIIHQLRALMAAAIAGDPFVPVNARRLRVVGFVTIALGLGWTPVSTFIVSHTVATADLGAVAVVGPPASWTAMVVLVVPGAVMLSLAEVFRWGSALRADADLTI